MWLAVGDVEAKMEADKARKREPLHVRTLRRLESERRRQREKARLSSLYDALELAEKVVKIAKRTATKSIALEAAFQDFRRAADKARPPRPSPYSKVA